MSILVTCGHPESGYTLAASALKAAGLAEPLPFHEGKLTARELVQKICKSHQSKKDPAETCGQISPSKLWQALAVDMMVANLEQDDWGWAAPQNLRLLDYWREFDAGFKFVLVYSSPEHAVARLIKKGDVDAKTVNNALKSWHSYNEALLAFFARNRERAILVNAEALSANPAEFLARCRAHFDVDLKLINEPVLADEPLPAAAIWSASDMVDGLSDAGSLFEELQSAADLPHSGEADGGNLGERAWAEYRLLLTRAEEAALQYRALTEEAEGQRKENELLVLQLEQMQEEIRELSKKSRGPERQDVTKTERENELLVLQLTQVQEELEHYFVKYNELHEKLQAAPTAAAPAPTPLPAETRETPPAAQEVVTIDMRHVVDGKNWYNAEQDGRWAGPGLTSIVKLPRIAAGGYRLELEVVDAILPEIVRGMEVLVNGRPVPMKRQSTGRLNGSMAPLRHAYLTYYKRGQVYPVMLKGEFQIDAGEEMTPPQLELKFPKTASPASNGGTDARNLAIRLRKISLSRS